MGLERYVRVPDTCPSLTALSSVMPCTHGERVSPVSGAWNAWRACMPPRMQPRHACAPRELALTRISRNSIQNKGSRKFRDFSEI